MECANYVLLKESAPSTFLCDQVCECFYVSLNITVNFEIFVRLFFFHDFSNFGIISEFFNSRLLV